MAARTKHRNRRHEWDRSEDPLVIAVRGDCLVGHGSLSYIEDCTRDERLLELFDDQNVKTMDDAVLSARLEELRWRGEARWRGDTFVKYYDRFVADWRKEWERFVETGLFKPNKYRTMRYACPPLPQHLRRNPELLEAE